MRIAKITASPFSDDGEMKHYHHPACIFETFKKARATTKIIEDPSDLDGWQDIKQEDRDNVLKLMKETVRSSPTKTPTKKPPAKKASESKSPKKVKTEATEANNDDETEATNNSSWKRNPINPGHKDNSFREFRRLCANIADTASYLDKSSLVRTWFNKVS